MKIAGTWLITEMSNWDEDYFNMEVPAYFEIDEIFSSKQIFVGFPNQHRITVAISQKKNKKIFQNNT
jgi:hypothetical protein